MELLRKAGLFKDLHRSGWPYAYSGLAQVASGTGTLLDDFVEASFSYIPVCQPHTCEWVGIFHHPAHISSLILDDQKWAMKQLFVKPRFRLSRPQLKGAIALSPCLGDWLSQQLKVPVLVVKHPTEVNVRQWLQLESESYTLFQTGFFLRNTRFVYCIPNVRCIAGRMRSKPHLPWQLHRDERLKGKLFEPIRTEQVIELEYMNAEDYDACMARCVVCMWSFGSSANNVVIECIARNTPLLVNRLPEIEWYLGKEYPLFFDVHKDIPAVLNDYNIRAAHAYLKHMDKSWITAEAFGKTVNDFVEGL